MGYTHYWQLTGNMTVKQREGLERQYQAAIKDCQRIVRAYNRELKAIDVKHPDRLAGTTAHTAVGEYRGVSVNGTGDLGYEDFSLPEHVVSLKQDSCKTAGKPYDVVVVACLIAISHRLGTAIHITSDGDSRDWLAGKLLASRILRKAVRIPSTIVPAELYLVG
jgi:hypothetical protein